MLVELEKMNILQEDHNHAALFFLSKTGFEFQGVSFLKYLNHGKEYIPTLETKNRDWKGKAHIR